MTELKTPNRVPRDFPTTRFPTLLPAAFAAALWLACAGTAEARKPNIVVILTDDQGYADVSYNPHHPKEVSTPNIDKLARSSVICTAGYTSGHVCSPTRAGLMTGRYQQRFGIYTAGEGGSGVPLSETFFPQHLEKAGYISGAFGKWHLGVDIKYNALHRGFDEFYGFMGRGAHDYFDLNTPDHPIYRGLEPIKDKGYLTDRITEEAVSFIRRHKDKPFFAYVAYNAVHSPAQAPAADIRKETDDPARNTLMAMLRSLDTGVGKIVDTLKSEGVYNNTLLFFLTDNGGSKVMHANNAPLRGYKQNDYEGGVRVPFIVSWPAKLKGGTTCSAPLMSIDILPTALAAAETGRVGSLPLDGRNIMPALEGKTDLVHEQLYWSSAAGKGAWAIRSGKWKLVGLKTRLELFDLESDIGESKDLSGKHPEQVKKLKRLYDAWLDEMAEPANGAAKRWSADTPASGKKNKKKSREEQRKLRDARRAKRKTEKKKPGE
ncbi:MAG: sulfatase-like hydrolase/transferase [Planctomycetota bacterium]|jgi:arylsulfatase A-like enzyme|nr:sulfatase-like hydrolase/transferase [Planctomycetota bacterium]HBO51343.1 N-acetylgalactosamine 6-sulfatase (GALNS) [Planctomycetota bacterium]